MKPKYLSISAIAFLGLALALRLITISSRPIWYDEAFSLLFAKQGPAAMMAGTLNAPGGSAAEEHPLLYYTLLWGWMRFFGQTPQIARLFSVFSGMGVIVWVYFLARDLLDDRFALVSLSMISLAPFQIHYSQEARMYALMTFFILGATFSLYRGISTRRWAWWLLFSVFSALAQYTHNLAIFYLLILALTPVWQKDWYSFKSVLLSATGAIILYFPWLLRLPEQLQKVQGTFWIIKPGPDRLLTTLLSFISNLPVPPQWIPLALFISIFVFALVLWQTFRFWRVHREKSRTGMWLAYLAFGPALILFLFSQWLPLYIERVLLSSGVFFLMWVAWALYRTELPTPIKFFSQVLLLAGFTLGFVQHIGYSRFPYAPYAELSAYLAENSTAEDVILHSNKLSMFPMVVYAPMLEQQYLADPSGSGSDTLALATQQVLGLIADPDTSSAVGVANRIWFIIFDGAIEEYQALGKSTHPHLAWLTKHYRLHNVELWNDLNLYIFRKE